MTYRYRFTSDTPLILFGLSYPSTTVTRDGKKVDAEGTVVAEFGDIIDAPVQYLHWYLEPLAAPTPTVRELRDQLTELGVEIPKGAKKTDLEALLREHENTAAGGTGNQSQNGDESSEGAPAPSELSADQTQE